MKTFRHTVSIVMALLLACVSCTGKKAAPQFDADSAWEYLTAQCAMGARNPGSAAHAEVIEYLKRELESSGGHVALQAFSVDDPYGEGTLELTNIIAKFRPREKKRVLLVAHFDTRPRADRETVDSLQTKPILGANDGASGVAVLLEIARLVGRTAPGNLGVDIIFFDGEDYGKESDLEYYLLGSKYFAAQLSTIPGGYHPRCAILLDMIGGDKATVYQEANSLGGAPEITRFLFTRADRLGLSMFVAKQGKAMYDDHIPLLMAGIPTVDLIDADYPYWHTLGDTPEHCSKESLRQTGVLLIDFLYNFPF
jgi:glutaminyl-peptide cyclotransferase